MSELLRTSAQRMAGRLSAGLSWLGDRAGSSLGILVYHRITPRVPGIPEPSINVAPQQFRRQLTGMLERGYQFWPLQRLLSPGGAELSAGKKVVVLTFDDGYECVLTEALPILRELSIPGTLFLNTAFLDSESPFPFDRWGVAHQNCAPADAWRPLRREQCREMLASGLMELAAHTHTHADFRGRTAAFKEDLSRNVAALKNAFDISRPSFAFPFGRWRLGYVSHELIAASRECGVGCALTTECDLVDPTTDPFGWGRFNIYDWDRPATIAARLRGWYSWAPRWQDRFRGMRAKEGAMP